MHKGFSIYTDDLRSKNLKIRFNLEASNFTWVLLGLGYIETNKQIGNKYSGIAKKFKITFGELLESPNFACYMRYKKAEGLNNLNKLKELKFGNLKHELIEDISKMLEIIEES